MINFFLIIISVFFNAAAQIFLKKGMIEIGRLSLFSISCSQIMALVCNIYLWITLLCYVVSIIFWIIVLSRVEVSYAYSFQYRLCFSRIGRILFVWRVFIVNKGFGYPYNLFRCIFNIEELVCSSIFLFFQRVEEGGDGLLGRIALFEQLYEATTDNCSGRVLASGIESGFVGNAESYQTGIFQIHTIDVLKVGLLLVVEILLCPSCRG